MSQNIPRRITRTTRSTLKDENANARPRITTRSKPPSASTATADKPAVGTRGVASGATSRARALAAKEAALTEQDPAAGKRKRSAFGEVGGPNQPKVKPPSTAGVKGKGKAEPAQSSIAPSKVLVKSTKTTTTTTAAAAPRVPLRTVVAPAGTKRVTRAATATEQQHQKRLPDVKEESEVVPRRLKHHTYDAPTAIPVPTRRSIAIPRSTVTTTTTVVNTAPTRRPLTSRTVKAERIDEEDEEEADRVFKKRRTSSEAPEDHHQVEARVATSRSVEEDQEAILRAEQEAVAELSLHVEQIQREEEADPFGDEWQDLDAEDAQDPLMVSEYVAEIFEYLKEVERTTMPNANYMDNQKDLAWKMRGILTDWLIQVHMRFRLLPETLFLAVNIIDRFLSSRVVSLAKLQLVGITCMFIAAKVEEIVAPSAQNFLYCADSSYTEGEILQAEKYILKTLEWSMNYPSPIHFLRRVSKADDYNVQVRTVAKYLMEIECVEWRLIGSPPSMLAAASIWLARLILGKEEWTPNLAHYSSYPESAIIPTANIMLNYILKPIRHSSFFKKYASKKYMKASTFIRDWALQRWEENQQVNLPEELPTLKALIRATRERAIEEGHDIDDTGRRDGMH